jgi:hypothetical protein
MKERRRRWILVALAPAFLGQSITSLELSPSGSYGVSRREALVSAAGVCSSLVVGHPGIATATSGDDTMAEGSFGFRAYSVIPDASASLNPEIVSIEVRWRRRLGLKLTAVLDALFALSYSPLSVDPLGLACQHY